MSYTRHGHHIEGTPYDAEEPLERARCGGPGICEPCSVQAQRALEIHKAKKGELNGRATT